MRKRGISAVEAMGILAIALGVVGAIDYFPQIPSPLTGEAPLWLFVGRFSQAIALGIVPAAVGIRLLRKREISAVQALGNLAMALGVIGAVYYFPSTFFLLAPDAQMLEVSLAQLVSFLTKAISLSIAPLIVGAVLMRNNDISTVKMLGILVIMSGVVWSIHKSGWSIATLMRLDEWEYLMKRDESYALFVVRAVVEFATVTALGCGIDSRRDTDGPKGRSVRRLGVGIDSYRGWHHWGGICRIYTGIYLAIRSIESVGDLRI